MEIRRLGPGDEEVVRTLARREPQTELLRDERTIFFAAFEDAESAGFVYGHVLPRREGKPAKLFVYELDVAERYRRRGLGAELMRRLAKESRAEQGFVLTEPDNEAANGLYRSLGGKPTEVVQWDFEYEGA